MTNTNPTENTNMKTTETTTTARTETYTQRTLAGLMCDTDKKEAILLAAADLGADMDSFTVRDVVDYLANGVSFPWTQRYLANLAENGNTAISRLKTNGRAYYTYGERVLDVDDRTALTRAVNGALEF